MARIDGGITGRPSGKIANIVFGAARSRTGKIVTARERVTPANPRTGPQQTQRSAFAAVLDAVRQIGPSAYRDAFNRTVGQLPGFQALMSVLLQANFGRTEVEASAPPELAAGRLDPLRGLNVVDMLENGQITVAWTQGIITRGSAADTVNAIVIEAQKRENEPLFAASNVDQYTRADNAMTLVGEPVMEGRPVVIGLWVEGTGTYEGEQSNIKWVKGVVGT